MLQMRTAGVPLGNAGRKALADLHDQLIFATRSFFRVRDDRT
jgi:hypothetical protein